MNDLYNITDKRSGIACPMVSKKFVDVVNEHAHRINSAIVYDRDFGYNYFGFKVCQI